MKCVVCNGLAEYVLFGKSLCKVHLEKLQAEIDAVDKEMEKKKWK